MSSSCLLQILKGFNENKSIKENLCPPNFKCNKENKRTENRFKHFKLFLTTPSKLEPHHPKTSAPIIEANKSINVSNIRINTGKLSTSIVKHCQ